jgi:hypothetical protein
MGRAILVLALMLGAASLGPPLPCVAKPPVSFPEREVVVAFVRVIPRGGAPVPGAAPLERLEPVLREALTDFLTTHAPPKVPAKEKEPAANLYKVLKKQTIHLGEPQLVQIGRRDEFEFRRVGMRGGWVECATLDDGVVMTSGQAYWKQLAKNPYLCGSHHFGSDVYVVAWVSIKTPVPSAPTKQ